MNENFPENTESLFFELAGDLRLSMIVKLSHNKYRLSQLATELKATMQEAHRNITRLVDSGLVFKDGEGDLGLTSYGKSIVYLLPGYEFLSTNKQYFLEHSIEELPLKFIQRIGSLKQSEIIIGVMANLQRWKKLYSNSEVYIKEIMSQVPLDLIEMLSIKIQTGVQFSYILSKDTIIPKGRTEILEKIGWNNMISRGLVERKMLPQIRIMTIFNEKESCLLFPNLKGQPDLNIMFYSKDTDFHEWCEDFFNYQWESAGPFDEKKLNET
ncbi:MAG: helix-turn-helix transcriptional regulator [Nitrososphaeraceae archaeon]